MPSDDLFAAFMSLVTAVSPEIAPLGDSEDLAKGAKYIPGEVTDWRRGGKTVNFIQPNEDDPETWYWTPKTDGSEIPYQK